MNTATSPRLTTNTTDRITLTSTVVSERDSIIVDEDTRYLHTLAFGELVSNTVRQSCVLSDLTLTKTQNTHAVQ